MWVAEDTAAGPRLGAWMRSHKGRRRGPHRDEAPQDGGPDFEAHPSEVARLMSRVAFARLGRVGISFFPGPRAEGEGLGEGKGKGRLPLVVQYCHQEERVRRCREPCTRPFVGRSDKGSKSGTLDSGPWKSRAPPGKGREAWPKARRCRGRSRDGQWHKAPSPAAWRVGLQEAESRWTLVAATSGRD